MSEISTKKPGIEPAQNPISAVGPGVCWNFRSGLFLCKLQLRNWPHTNDLQLSVEIHFDHQSRLRGSFGLPHAFALKSKLLSLNHHDPRARTWFAQNFASGLHPFLA